MDRRQPLSDQEKMQMRYVVLIGFLCAGTAVAAPAIEDPYHLTELERSACTDDAVRLCANAYPDPQALLACMKANRPSLSPVCLPVFDAGLKKRHL